MFLLRYTGMPVHIAIYVVGALVLVAYTVLTKKEWKLPALEIIVRAFYGIALISGVVMLNVHGIAAIAIMHKVSEVLFMALIIVLLSYKLATKKKRKFSYISMKEEINGQISQKNRNSACS